MIEFPTRRVVGAGSADPGLDELTMGWMSADGFIPIRTAFPPIGEAGVAK